MRQPEPRPPGPPDGHRPVPHSLDRVSTVLLSAVALVGALGVAAAVTGAVVNGNSVARLVANAALPAALLVVALVGRRCTPARRMQLALCSAVSVLTLFLFAAVLDIVRMDPFERRIRAVLASGGEFDDRTTRRFVLDSRKSGSLMLPLMTPRALIQPDGDLYRSSMRIEGREVIPLSYVSHATVAMGNESGRHVVVTLDRFGYNNPDYVWDLPSIDVAAVGDSFTMGKCVDTAQNAIGRIRAVVPSTVNLGFTGNSPLTNLATLLEYAAPLKPRFVLWMHYANDLAPYEIDQDAKTPLLMRYFEPGFSQHLEDMRPQLDSWLRDRAELQLAESGPDSCWEMFRALRGTALARVRRVALLSDMRSMIAGALGERSRGWSPNLSLYMRVLETARARVSSWGGRFVWVCIPDVEEFSQSSSSDLTPVFRCRDELLRAVRDAGIDVLDMMPPLASRDAPTDYYAWNRTSAAGLPHLNAEGYSLAADEILRVLEQAGLATSYPSRRPR